MGWLGFSRARVLRTGVVSVFVIAVTFSGVTTRMPLS
jgi:hypothetical protein